MKKSLVKLAALSSAAFVLAGTVTPIVVNQVAAQEIPETQKIKVNIYISAIPM